MTNIPTAPPSGFRDFLPDACAARARAVETISRVYRAYGFMQIATSALEDLAVLTGKGGGENEKLIFKVLKRGEKLDAALAAKEDPADMGLRFDLTLPLARFYSKHKGVLPHPFKAFHIGPVWRAERAQKGRYREFYQCDVDVIGSESALAEIEVMTAILSAFKQLGVEPTLFINDRRLLLGKLRAMGVPDASLGAACVALDKMDKIDAAAVQEELTASGAAAASGFLKIERLEQVQDVDAAAADGLRRVIDTVNDISGREAAVFSAQLVRGFDYYTGPVFEFRHPHLSGSLGGGGRYDRLTEKFGGSPVPACGASIGFERLMLLLEETGRAPEPGPQACLMVFEETREASLRLAARLREKGFSIDVYPGTGKLKAQFKYADQRGAALALVLGPDEAAAGKVKAKDLKTGEEALETFESLAARLAALPRA